MENNSNTGSATTQSLTPEEQKKQQDIILQNIFTRTSDRMFDVTKEVGPDDINILLRAGMSAPSAVNRQPWQFVVVTNRQLLNQLATTLPYCHMADQAPLAIVVCGDKQLFLEGEDNELWVQDLSAATENILLAAHALGLGSVWTCLYPHTDRMGNVSEILTLPEDFVPFNVIPIGYVRMSHTPLDKWNPAAITYRT